MTGKRILPLLAFALICACGGGLDSHDAVIEAMVVEMGAFATLLEKIDSKESADAAAGDLEKVAERMAEISEARKELGEPDKSTDAELEKKYRDRMMKIMQRIGEAAQTAGPFMAESEKCQQAFQRVGQKLQGMD